MSYTPVRCLVRKPKAPLSAYNLYFQLERKRILNGTGHLCLSISHEELRLVAAEHKAKEGRRPHRKSHGKIGFKELARIVAQRWKGLGREAKEVLEDHAKFEKEEYRFLNEAYMKTQEYQMELQGRLEENPSISASFGTNFLPNLSSSNTHAFDEGSIFLDSYSKTSVMLPKESPRQVSTIDLDNQARGQLLSLRRFPEEYVNTVGAKILSDDLALSMHRFQWDEDVYDHQERQGATFGNNNESLCSKLDLIMVKDMVDLHLAMFPGTSSLDLLNTADLLHEVSQGDFFPS